AFAGSAVVAVETAGDHLIVIKTDIGQASATALAIDRAAVVEIVGTVAGDDTLFVAVKNADAQRSAMKEISRLFAPAADGTTPRGLPDHQRSQANGARRRATRTAGRGR